MLDLNRHIQVKVSDQPVYFNTSVQDLGVSHDSLLWLGFHEIEILIRDFWCRRISGTCRKINMSAKLIFSKFHVR